MIPFEREIDACCHWMVHRLAACGLTGNPESCLIEDEWAIVGGLPPGAVAAIERGDDHLTAWCPELARYRSISSVPTTS